MLCSPHQMPWLYFHFQAQESLRAEEPEHAPPPRPCVQRIVEAEQTRQHRDGGAEEEDREPRTRVQ